MPPVGSVLSDDQIAAVLTYIRREWGQAGTPVDAATVKGVRASTAEPVRVRGRMRSSRRWPVPAAADADRGSDAIMEYRQLGGSGFKVPVLSLGTGTFGGGGEFFKPWGATDVAGRPGSSTSASTPA